MCKPGKPQSSAVKPNFSTDCPGRPFCESTDAGPGEARWFGRAGLAADACPCSGNMKIWVLHGLPARNLDLNQKKVVLNLKKKIWEKQLKVAGLTSQESDFTKEQ